MKQLDGGSLSPELTILLGCLVALAVGLTLGLVNGLVITKLKISPLVATLGMLGVASGGTQLVNGGQELSGFPPQLVEWGNKVLLNDWLAVPVLIASVIALAGGLVLRNTRFGQRTFACGSNPEASRRTGVNVERHLIKVYAVAGLLSGLAGVVQSARAITGQAGMGVMAELDAIAASVIGGASLAGGVGRITGTVFGTLILGVMTSGFTFLRIDAYYQEIIKGVVIIGAVVADQHRQRSRMRA